MSRNPWPSEPGVPSRENLLVEALIGGLLRGDLGPVDNYATEVRSEAHARIDLVFIVDGKLVGVEVKRVDWQRGLAQAFLNRSYVDASYLALWHTMVKPQIVDEAFRTGLGILAISESTVHEVLKPPDTPVESFLRDRVASEVRGRNA